MGWLGRVAAVLAVLAVLAACSFERPTHTTVLPESGMHHAALPLRLFDRTGLVREIQAIPLPADWGLGWSEDPKNPDGHADQVLIRWTGGACEDATVMDLHKEGDGHVLVITLEDGAFGGCPAVGIPRQLLLFFSQPMDATSIAVERG